MIPLSLGDPTVYGNLLAPEQLTEAVVQQVRSKRANGYGHSAGLPAARTAVAKFMSTETSPLTSDDIIMASGGSGALEIAISGLVNEGDNILVPRPGFPLYQVIAESNGAHVIEYPLLAEQNWQADVEAMEALVTERTRAILVNNPSNPCGSVFSQETLKGILGVAEKKRIPIIADEIYGEMVFTGQTFTPIASLTTSVPVIAMGGMAKMFLVPGWRVGWLCVHDRAGILQEARQGFMNLSQLILGSNTLVQSALEQVLTNDRESLIEFNRTYVAALENGAKCSMNMLSKAKGLSLVEPGGAMYMMVRVHPEAFKDILDDKEFAQMLLKEEAVFVLPGSCFGAPNFFRIVFTAPEEKLQEAYDRIIQFCERHAC